LDRFSSLEGFQNLLSAASDKQSNPKISDWRLVFEGGGPVPWY
jgi:hypothetical protein